MSSVERIESLFNSAELTVKNQLIVFIKELSKYLALTLIVIITYIIGTGIFPINDIIIWFIFLIILIAAVISLFVVSKAIRWRNNMDTVFREVMLHSKNDREKLHTEIHAMRKEQDILHDHISVLKTNNSEMMEANLILQNFTLQLVEKFFVNTRELEVADELIVLCKKMMVDIKGVAKQNGL